MITLFFLLCLPLTVGAFDSSFTFGVANAPAQVEDSLQDIWETWGNNGQIKSWKETYLPEKRIEFWSHPEVELDLAQKLGVHSFRLGVDWFRVMPTPTTFDESAISKYRKILQGIRDRGMKVMLTLSHHSVPDWVQKQDGWHNSKTKEDFLRFAQRMMEEFHGEVEWWISFNEANVFVVNAYTAGFWPPGVKGSILSLAAIGPYKGRSIKALDMMADAHNELYTWAHKKFPSIQLGVAHNMANYRGRNFLDKVAAYFADQSMNWRFPERIRGNMDFYGVNYYGAEWIKGAGLEFNPEAEYSESGRAIDTSGFLELLKEIHSRFPDQKIMITENGIADTDDGIRSSYILEHLAAIKGARDLKIPVVAYYLWTLTDNLEWTDGYCPKFGLVAVDRKTMKRSPRPSYYIFQRVIKENDVTLKLRQEAWKKVVSLFGKFRPFCRHEDGVTALDLPIPRRYGKVDWRFN